MAYKLSEFQAVTGHVAGVLKSLGLADTDQLLMVVTDPAQRAALLSKLGVDERFLTSLIEQVDLTRISGIGPAFAQLLSVAGIRSVTDLAGSSPATLLDTLTRTATTTGVKRVPTEEDLRTWISSAKATPDLTTWATDTRVSSLRGLFAEDEWTKVRLAPLAVAAMVMGASPSKGDDAAAEVAATATAVDDARKGGQPWSLLNVAFGSGISAAEMEKFMRETPPSAMLSTAKAAVATVAAKDPEAATAYRDMLLAVGVRVAEAAKEGGFLGMGKKVISDEEQAVLDELRAAL
jgi:hypothetical protein